MVCVEKEDLEVCRNGTTQPYEVIHLSVGVDDKESSRWISERYTNIDTQRLA